MDKHEIQEYIEQAIIAGRASSSNLAGGILDKMGMHIGEAIDIKINGKLIKIQEHLGKQDRMNETILEEIKTIQKEQVRLKFDTDPVIEIQRTALSVGRLLKWVSGFGWVGIAITGVYKILSK